MYICAYMQVGNTRVMLVTIRNTCLSGTNKTAKLIFNHHLFYTSSNETSPGSL